MNTQKTLEKALAYHQAGDLHMAVQQYQAIIKQEPKNINALNLMGVAKNALGDSKGACTLYEQAIKLNPSFASVYINYAIALNNLQQYADALLEINRASELTPDDSRVYFNKALILQNQEKFFEAKQEYIRTLQLNSADIDALNNISLCCVKLNKISSSVKYLEEAIDINPNYIKSYNNLGLVYKNYLRDFEQANKYFISAIKLNNSFIEAWNNYAGSLILQGNYQQAKLILEDALKINTNAVLLFNLGVVELLLQNYSLSYQYFNKVLELEPNNLKALPYIYQLKKMLCDWSELDTILAKLDHAVSLGIVDEPPFINIARTQNLTSNYKTAKLFSANLSKTVQTIKQESRVNKAVNTRVKIGYLSQDIRRHATSYLMHQVFKLHDKSKFEVYLYSYGPPDNSKIRQDIISCVEHFIEIYNFSDSDIVNKIQADNIDILIDLKGYTEASRPEVLALRPCSVQINYLGFPGTMGADFIDYIIADKVLIEPGEEQFYQEQVLYMPNSYQATDISITENLPKVTKAEAGLPRNKLILCSFNQSYKIEPECFHCWLEMLNLISDSVLWLQVNCLEARNNLVKQAQKYGVEPARLIFADKLPKQQHIARLQLADLALDTWTYNGHTTTSDMLMAGVPVITLKGRHFASRVSASILTAIGLEECITLSEQQYLEKVLSYCRDLDKLGALKQSLADNILSYPLFDSVLFTKNLEALLKNI